MSRFAGALPRAIVLDLDGTLVDSLPDITDALNHGLASEGLAPLSRDRVRTLVGGGIGKLVQRALGVYGDAGDGARVDRMRAAVVAAYAARPCARTELYPRARETIASLRGQGVLIGLCTNKLAPITGAILAALDVRDYFESVVGAGPGLALKPAPDMLRAVLAELSVAPGEAVMVGDSDADVGTARACGCRVVVLAHGYSHTAPEQLGADAVIEGFAELEAAVRAIS